MGIDNPVHLIFLAAVALIVLGPKRLPDMARSLGHGLREFRDSMSEAASGDAQADEPLIPQQAQLVAAQEPVPATPADAVVVDPAAPVRPPQAVQVEQAAPTPQVEQQATPVQTVAAETVAQSPPPHAS
jgi:TatA/E family protein of Tat protein translocase